jgi:hypothetical protein
MQYTINKKTVTIESRGTKFYYRKEDVQRSLCKARIDSLDESDLEYIRYSCKPFRVKVQ